VGDTFLDNFDDTNFFVVMFSGFWWVQWEETVLTFKLIYTLSFKGFYSSYVYPVKSFSFFVN
jgi:hypothetical protein